VTVLSSNDASRRVVSGMRPTGRLHLGHYHGVLKNWIKLQHEYECYFFVADWHALTTHYDEPYDISQFSFETVIDWLAAGVNPGSATLFLQSRVLEHAELHVLLSMITPVGWLERVPSYKEQQAKLNDRDLSTYGFLGYPVLQSADILVYRGGKVPVGADQVAHIEITREIARRFNHIYGREPGFEQNAEAAVKKMGKKNAKLFVDLRKRYLEKGDANAHDRAHGLIASQQNLSIGDRERLEGYLKGTGRIIFPEPEALLTEQPLVLGTDGGKMSKSVGNTIGLREDPRAIEAKLDRMVTDPARVRRTDPGNPDICPVFSLHKIHSDIETVDEVNKECRVAGIGCMDCKARLARSVNADLAPIREAAQRFENDPDTVYSILKQGAETARVAARATLEDVRAAIGLSRH
jgi:tryptophanyl-tRNA synthetase